MSTISLEAAIRTCKVDQGWANKIESDRFFNPHLMMCPVWSGRDITGRPVCPDSWNTKREGCNSANDRITVENALRPQYIEYVTLDAAGIRGNFGDGVTGHGAYPAGYSDVYDNARGNVTSAQALNKMNDYTGNFGLNFRANVFPGCASYPYARGMSGRAQNYRGKAFSRIGYNNQCSATMSGF